MGIEEVFKRVRISVLNLTQSKQIPWESSSLTSDFYFVGQNTNNPPKRTEVPGAPPVSNGSASQDRPNPQRQVVKENFFTFELQGCRRSGSLASCELVVINNDKDRYFDISEYETLLYDNLGRESKTRSISVAGKTGNSSIGLLVSGLPTRAELRFEDLSPEATRISLLTINCRAPQTSNGMGGDVFKIQFRDIPLAGTGPTSPEPPNLQGQIVKENLFAVQLQECEQSGSTVSCRFVVTNNDRDRYFDISDYETLLYDDLGKASKTPSVTVAGKTGYNRISLMVSGIPTKAEVRFEGVSPEATRISLLTISCRAPQTSNGMGGDVFKIQFRNIQLRR